MTIDDAMAQAKEDSLDGHLRFVVLSGNHATVAQFRDFANNIKGTIFASFFFGKQLTAEERI